ncbi:PIN-like domain-containing protein [Luedemannella flava]
MTQERSAGEVAAAERLAEDSPRGLFDGFEGYITPTLDEYRKALADGMVAIDTNVLLNLYRFTTEARDDLLAVLTALANRLWVPHQVVAEFWRNRESVLRDPRGTNKAINDLTDHRDKSLNTFRSWANRVALPEQRSKELQGELSAAFDSVIIGVDESADPSAIEWARDTSKDPILQSLGEILRGRVGPALDESSHDAAVREGLRRVELRLPPGYMDKRKGEEAAAGDYLVWEQLLIEAAQRRCDVVLVTGDVKEDWWREESGERRGARIELVEEMRKRSGGSLFMIRPAQLLEYAGAALAVTVRNESVQDAERIDQFLSETEEDLANGGWNEESLRVLLTWLSVEASVQESVIRLAAEQDGYVSREQIYTLGSYPEDRSLRGFTRPVSRITQALRDNGVVPEGAVDLLRAVYNENSPNVGWAAGFRIHQQALPELIRLVGINRDAIDPPGEMSPGI